ncbi:MAG: hypothetical protein SGILL_002658 [Bacillariaceae sp.]
MNIPGLGSAAAIRMNLSSKSSENDAQDWQKDRSNVVVAIDENDETERSLEGTDFEGPDFRSTQLGEDSFDFNYDSSGYTTSAYLSSRQVIDESIALNSPSNGSHHTVNLNGNNNLNNNNNNWETTTATTSNNGDTHFRMLLDNFSEADDNNDSSLMNLERIARELEVSLPLRDHRWRVKVYKKSFVGSECVDFLVRARYATSRAAAVTLGRKIAKQFNLFEHVCRDHELMDSYLFYRFVEPERRTRPQATIYQDDAHSEKIIQDAFLLETADVLRRELDIRDRFFRLKKYRKCFVASDAVTWMVKNNLAQSREEAVDLGRRMEAEIGLWRHVVNEHHFADEYLFFHIVDNRESKSGSSPQGDDSSQPSRGTQQKAPSATNSQFSKRQLQDMADQLRKGLNVRDRRYRLKVYRSCFIAQECVDYMVENDLVATRQDAVDLGRCMQEEQSLFYHVTNDHKFKDEYLFFRFDSAISDGSYSETRETSHDAGSVSASDMDENNLATVARKLQLGIKVKDRLYRLKSYPRCFVGCEATDFLVQARFASSREDAIELGRRLMHELKLFEHVTQGHTFEDGYLFYRFNNHATDALNDSIDGGLSGKLEESISTGIGESIPESDSTDLAAVAELSREFLSEVALDLKRAIKIKDRMYRLKVYKNCWVGTEAVDFLVQSGVASSRSAAIAIGRRLQAECGCFQHVEDDHFFDDAYLFFRFNVEDRKTSGHDSVAESLYRSMSVQQPTMQSRRLPLTKLNLLRKKERESLIRLLEASKQGTQVVEIVGSGGNGKTDLVLSAFTACNGILFADIKFDESGIVESLLSLKRLFLELCKQVAASLLLKDFLGLLSDETLMTESEYDTLLEWEPEASVLFSNARRADDRRKGKRISDFFSEVKRGFRSFLHIVSQIAPTVLFLDDAGSADTESLETLNFVLEGSTSNVLACVAYRDDKVTPTHPLSGWRKISSSVFAFETIKLDNLTQEDVAAMLESLLRIARRTAGRRVAQVLYYQVQMEVFDRRVPLKNECHEQCCKASLFQNWATVKKFGAAFEIGLVL